MAQCGHGGPKIQRLDIVVCAECRAMLYRGPLRERDTMSPEEITRYEALVYDGARDIAEKYQKTGITLYNVLVARGAPQHLAAAAQVAAYSPQFQLTMYRGKMVDEGVVEAVKDCLRHIHGFAKAPEQAA